ncbi:MAG: hypothetical protein HY912_15615 [Desulfomonile tiedjei]|uniref:Uncharacterized protein n=1 Tax=Desulfomonile tiedjei TaxID=2358 RepID=A0A9D6V5A9_9BACT|nr:hypothetical protein [Desulfomonile tiedjei]
MRKLLVFALIILAFSCMAGMLYAEEEVYWDRSTPPDATITDEDFDLDYTVRATKSFGDQEIYDSMLPPEIDSRAQQGTASEAVAAEAAPGPATPIQPPSPTVRSNVLPRGFTLPPASRTPPSAATSVTQTTPKPAETTPGAEVQSVIPKSDSRTSIQDDDSKRGAAVQAAGSEADRPVSKKMRWGQADTQKPEQKADQQNKFQWGRQRQ